MLRGSHTHDLWVLKDQLTFKKVAKRINVTQTEYEFAAISDAFAHWQDVAAEIKKLKIEQDQRNRFVDILRNSTRGHRSTMEKEEIRRFISGHLSCIPKSISFSEMDMLCNELDWIPYVGRSILFLQGDFGNCYYMIANGRVGLYLEGSKDREMVIAREFGHQRLQPFQGSDEDLLRLGVNIVNLPQGSGFGEFAILASSNKIRSCAAVALDDHSMLLVMHAETYNAVLRQHHYRQKQLSSATALLQELPLFRHQNFSKVASIAYTMRSQTYSNQSLVVAYGTAIQNVMLVASGQVKVFAPPSAEDAMGNSKLMQKRIPKLAIALLGRGQIIGEMEVQKGLSTFQLTYESGAAGTEVLEMPLSVFKESISTGGVTQSMMYKNIEEMNVAKEQRRVGRLNRAYEAMKTMMGAETSALQSKDQLAKVLPVLLDAPALSKTAHKGIFDDSPHAPPTRRDVGSYYGDGRPAVTRMASFSLKAEDGAPSSPARTGVNPAYSTAHGSLKFSTPTRKGSVMTSPRKEDAISAASPTRAHTIVQQQQSPFASSPSGPKPSASIVNSPRLSMARHTST